MILKSKICGVSDSKILNHILNHKNPPQFIGFIVNYTESKRYVDINKLKELLKINKINLNIIQKMFILLDQVIQGKMDLKYLYQTKTQLFLQKN